MFSLSVCNVGYYLQDTTCTKCAVGTYKTEVGNEVTLCLACPDGEFTSTTGNTANTDCSKFYKATVEFQLIYNWNSKIEAYSAVCVVCQPPKSFLCFVECNVGYGGTTGSCTACSGDTYKSNIANTDCLAIPNQSTVKTDHTGFSKFKI